MLPSASNMAYARQVGICRPLQFQNIIISHVPSRKHISTFLCNYPHAGLVPCPCRKLLHFLSFVATSGTCTLRNSKGRAAPFAASPVDDWGSVYLNENLHKCARQSARSIIMAGALLCDAFSTVITTSLLVHSANAATILRSSFKHTVRTTDDGGTALLFYFKL